MLLFKTFMAAHETGCFPIIRRRLRLAPLGFVGHGEPIQTINLVRIPLHEAVANLLRRFEAFLSDQVKNAIGESVKFLNFCIYLFDRCRGRTLINYLAHGSLLRYVPREAAFLVFLTTAAVAGIISAWYIYCDNVERSGALALSLVAHSVLALFKNAFVNLVDCINARAFYTANSTSFFQFQ